MSTEIVKNTVGESSRSAGGDLSHAVPAPLSRYESQKRRDWNTFGQYLKNQRPPVSLSQCNCNNVLDFLRYLDQFGKTKVHINGCVFFGQPDPPAPCTCPLRQAWGSLDALIGRLRAAYEEHGGSSDTNPFGNGAIRVYLREVKECQAKARGIPYKKKKKKKNQILKGGSNNELNASKQSIWWSMQQMNWKAQGARSESRKMSKVSADAHTRDEELAVLLFFLYNYFYYEIYML